MKEKISTIFKKYFDRKYWKIYIVILLALAAVVTTVVCIVVTNQNKEPKETTPQNITPEVTTPETKQPLLDPSLSILTEALANYEVIYAKDSSQEVKDEIKKLVNAIYDSFGAMLNQRTDLYYEGVETLKKGQYEILVGHTNREESDTLLAQFKWDDYGYGIVGDKLVIAGKNEDNTLQVLRDFIEQIKSNKGQSVFFNNADQHIVFCEYPHNSLMINNIPAKDLSILCNEQELGGIAQIIRDTIIEASGIALPIVTDKDIDNLENVIIVGDTAFIDIDAAPDEIAYPTGREYYIDTSWGCVWLRAKTAAGYYNAATEVATQLSGSNDDNVILVSGKREGKDAIAVMSFNLMAGKEDKRADSIVETILKYCPAVVGVQEATDNWMNILRERLGDTYTIVGVGRNAEGHDEHSAILYLTEEFECLESGTKWLSDTPDVAGSKFAASHYTRIMTYAHLSRRSDGKQFLHVNTHLDYTLKPEEQATQVAQMQVILNEIEKFAGVPTIITGDFNATAGSPVYEMITVEGYQDSCYASAIQSPTYHALMGTTGAPSHIDFAFGKGIYNLYYRICTERIDNENVSDHYPILTVLAFSSIGK